MGVEIIKQGHIYRIRSRTAPNLLLELKDGTKNDGTQAQCWNDVNDWEAYFNQIWLVNKDTSAGREAWTLQNLKAGSHTLTLKDAEPNLEPRFKAAEHLRHPSADPARFGFWSQLALKAVGGLVVDLTDGGKGNGNPVGGWTNQPGNTNQIWDFEQYSFTPDELDGHIKSMPLKPGANIVSYTSFEKKYLILPTELYEKIRCTANIAGCRPGVFDYDNLALTYKSAVAKYGAQYIDPNVANVALLAGVIYGSRGEESHACNWSLSPVDGPMLPGAANRLLKYFDPQQGKWVENCEYQFYFVLL